MNLRMLAHARTFSAPFRRRSSWLTLVADCVAFIAVMALIAAVLVIA